MPHQCVKCSRIIPIASKELLEAKYGKTGAFKKSDACSINRITTSWEYIPHLKEKI